jgi:hypothetical protein
MIESIGEIMKRNALCREAIRRQNMELLKIKMTKFLLVISEEELIKHLPSDVLVRAIYKGKQELRRCRVDSFYAEPMSS